MSRGPQRESQPESSRPREAASPGPPPGLGRTLAGLGGFFAWAQDPPIPVPLAESLDRSSLTARFEATRVRLAGSARVAPAEVDVRVAVSAVQVGLVSRLWSAALASVLLHGWVPDLRVPALRCDPDPAVPWRLSPADPAAGRATDGDPAYRASVVTALVTGPVRTVSEVCSEVGRTSQRVMVSNAASSLVGGVRVLTQHHPEVSAAADVLVLALLRDPWLRSGGNLGPEGLRRSGCCLYYRLPGHGLCPDCVLVRPGHPADEHH